VNLTSTRMLMLAYFALVLGFGFDCDGSLWGEVRNRDQSFLLG
jgi:hypothetical protein